MIRGRYIGSPDNNEIEFEITFTDNNIVTSESEAVNRYIRNIDTTLELSPLEANRDITFETATERDLVIFLEQKSGFKVDEYPESITLVEEPESEEEIYY
ncbi:MAG: hypothetical protein K9K32_07680 [Halanaerobiales bacterium]|nr:hypothetical protein [Halanaerobiales bacterium]